MRCRGIALLLGAPSLIPLLPVNPLIYFWWPERWCLVAPCNGMSGPMLESPFKDYPQHWEGGLGSCSGSRLHPQAVQMQLSLWDRDTPRAPSPWAAWSRKSSAVSQSLIRFPTDSSPQGAQQMLAALQPGCLQGCQLCPAVPAPSVSGRARALTRLDRLAAAFGGGQLPGMLLV